MTNVQLTVRGEVSDEGADYALGKIRHVVSRAARVDQVHVVLTVAAHRAHEAPVSVEAEVDVTGSPVHVHAAAASLNEAVDEAADRIRRRLTDQRERARSGRRAGRAVATSAEEPVPTATEGPGGAGTAESTNGS